MRKWVANKLAGLARLIYPQSEEVMAFYTDRMMDQIITGQSFVKITRVPPEEIQPWPVESTLEQIQSRGIFKGSIR